MGKNSSQRTEEAKQKVLDALYIKQFKKTQALMGLKNLYIMLAITERQIYTGELFNPKDTLELVILRHHQICMQIENEIFAIKNNNEFIVMDQDLNDIKDEAKNEIKNGKSAIIYKIYEPKE